MRKASVDLYLFDELTDEAKERARAWFLSGMEVDAALTGTLEDAKLALEIVGVREAHIHYSGFDVQGSGACFTGVYFSKEPCAAAMKDFAPVDPVLNEIAVDLDNLQSANKFDLTADLRLSPFSRSFHEHSVFIQVSLGGDDAPEATADELADIFRRLMCWVYAQLYAQYEHIQSDEYVDDCIQINEYEFAVDGRRAPNFVTS